MNRFFCFIFLLIFFLSGCWNGQVYNRVKLYELGRKVDSKLSFVNKESSDFGTRGLSCLSYGRYCQEVFALRHKGIPFIFVKYEDEERALRAAEVIDAYVTRNWLLDWVTGEPVLEKFVKKAWGAKRAGSVKSF